MSNHMEVKKRVTQLIVALVVICLTVTGAAFLLKDFVKDATAATYDANVYSAATWTNAVNRTSGSVVNITVTGDFDAGGKLTAIPQGVTVNLNMNGHTIYWDYEGSSYVPATSYTSGTYADGTYWGLITNSGTLNITGTGTIRNKRTAYGVKDNNKRGDYPQRLATIVNNGTGKLTVGGGITVQAYLGNMDHGDKYKDQFLYNCGIYNEGTLTSAANIDAGCMAGAYSGGTNSYHYAISYGIYGGNVTTNGGTINIEAYSGGYDASRTCAEGNQMVEIAVGVYSNSAKIMGTTTINTLTKGWQSKTGNDNWGGEGYNIMWSAGVMYTTTNYPIIGAGVNIDASFQMHTGGNLTMPGTSQTYGDLKCDDEGPHNHLRRANAVVGVTQNVNTIGKHTSEKTFQDDGGFFGTINAPGGSGGENYLNFEGNTNYYRAEDPYHDSLTGTSYMVNTSSYTQSQSGRKSGEYKTSSIKNGGPGTDGTQYLIMYRYYKNNMNSANLQSVSYTYDPNIQATRAYLKVANTNTYTGVITDSSSTVTLGGGGLSKNSYYYEFLGATTEKIASKTYATRNINTLSQWTGGTTALPSGGTTAGSGNTLIVYMNYALKDPSAIRVAVANQGTEIGQYTETTDFTATYTGKALVPGTDFNIGIIDMGKEDAIAINDMSDDTVVTNVYNVTGNGSGSGNNNTGVAYRYTTDAVPSASSTWVDGLPKDAGKYVIEVKVNADTTFAPSGTYNRLGTLQYITCTITKADVTITGPSSQTGTYGSTLAELVPFSSYTVTGKASDSPSGTWAFDQGFKTTDFIGAGSYNLNLVWTPTPGSASENNYNAAVYPVTLVVDKRNVTVNIGASKVGYGDETVTYTLAYENLANCDIPKTTDWAKATTGLIYYNGEWVAYSAGVPMGTYDAKIEVFGGKDDQNNNFTLNTTNGTLEVGKRMLHYTATAKDRAYIAGDSTVEVTLNYVSGAYGSDPVQTVINATGTMANPNAGQNKMVTVDVDALNASILGANANYQIVIDNASALTVNISKADPSGVSCVADPDTYAYDSTRTLSEIALKKVNTSVAGNWDWQEPDIIPTCDVPSYTAVFTPTDTNNYNSITQTVNVTIEQAEVIVTVPTQNLTYGDSVPALVGKIKYSGFTGTDSIDTVPTTGGTEVTTTYTRGSAVGTYPISVTTTLDSTNYKFKAQDSTIVVGKKDLTITAKDDAIIYGSATPEYDTTDLIATGFYGSDSLASLGGTPIVGTTYWFGNPVDTYKIYVGGYTSDNYNIIFVPGTLTVNKAELTVTPTAQTVTYGADAPAYAANKLYKIEGYIAGDTASSVTIEGAPAFTTGYQSGRNAGTYPVTVDTSGMSSMNYTFKGAEGTLTVEKATPVIDTAPSASIIHAQAYSEAVFTNDAVVLNPNKSDMTVAGTFTLVDSSAIANYGEGMKQVEAIFTPNDTLNYTTTTVQVWLQVSQKTITGNPIIKGSPMIGETLTADLSAMDPGDGAYYNYQWYADDAPISGAINSTYTVSSAYLGAQIHVVVTADDSTGYTGTAASTKTSKVIKQLTPASAEQIDFTIPENCTYDGLTHEATATVKTAYTGYVGEVTLRYNGSETLPKNAGTYIVTADVATPDLRPGDSDYNENYYGPVSGLEVGTFTIEKAPYTVTVNAEDKVYDGMKNATATVTTAGVIGSDDVALASGYTFVFDTANVGTDKTVTASGLVLTGTTASNYKIVPVNGTADITPRTLTARANGVTKVYDGSGTVDVTFSNISGYADVDSASTVYFTNGKAVAVSANVGTQILSDITYTLGGSAAGNYVVAISNIGAASVDITPADPVVTAPTITGLTYNSARTLQSVDLSAFTDSNGYWQFDDLTVVPTVTVKKYAATYYPSSSNYKTYSTQITVEVDPAPVVLRAEDKVVQYGQKAPTFTIVADGLTGLDQLGDIGGSGATATTTYFPGEPVGSYAITVNYSFDSDNYVFSTQPGTLIVTPATLVVQATADSKVYDGNTDVNVNFTIASGKFGMDDVSLTFTSTTGTTATANAGNTTVTYTAPQLKGAKADNYEIYVSPASGVLTVEIKKADVTGVVFPTEGEVEFGYDLSHATFATDGIGDGTFAYENAKGTIPGALGVYTNYKVIFTPTDSRNYNSQEAYVTLTVVKCQLDYVVGIAGTAREGERLSVVITGMPSLANDYIQYQWYRTNEKEAKAIEGATGSSYTATKDDIGYTLVVVTYFDSSAPYVFADYAEVISIDDVIFGIIGQTTGKVEAIKLTFWQRLMNWIYRIIAAITGIISAVK